ncbi:hypothetical protein ATANTOWER_004218, partial [Ataeniobius toweri]|nr:hypothetical protein [Ataeniobius toweri]
YGTLLLNGKHQRYKAKAGFSLCLQAGERREAVLSSLVKYLGPEAASCIHFEEKDWAKEEYSGGCPVNVMAPGLLTYYQLSLRKPCGR